MKVKELIAELEKFDGEAEVYYAYNYGDYWHTRVAGDVSEVEMGEVMHSAYHDMMKVVENNPDDEEISEAIILS